VAIYALERASLSWHLDDSPDDQIVIATGEAVFTPEEIPVARAVQDAIWEHCGNDPHGIAIAACNLINPGTFNPEGDEEFALTVEEAGIVAATATCPVLRGEAERFLLDTAPVPKHVMPAGGIGVPYAEAGVEKGKATATCPVCGLVFHGRDHKAAGRAYGIHFAAAAEAGR